MPRPAHCCALLLALAGPAFAREPDFRISPVDRGPAPGSLIAAASIGERIRFGVGRFGVADRPRPRTHIEPVPLPTDVRLRHRGTAALGFSFSF